MTRDGIALQFMVALATKTEWSPEITTARAFELADAYLAECERRKQPPRVSNPPTLTQAFALKRRQENGR